MLLVKKMKMRSLSDQSIIILGTGAVGTESVPSDRGSRDVSLKRKKADPHAGQSNKIGSCKSGIERCGG
jgi:hypothetical protein